MNFLYRFSKKKPRILNFIKIRLVGAELFLAGGRTDRQTNKLNEANGRFLLFFKYSSKLINQNSNLLTFVDILSCNW